VSSRAACTPAWTAPAWFISSGSAASASVAAPACASTISNPASLLKGEAAFTAAKAAPNSAPSAIFMSPPEGTG
jgi:hypothetical protein